MSWVLPKGCYLWGLKNFFRLTAVVLLFTLGNKINNLLQTFKSKRCVNSVLLQLWRILFKRAEQILETLKVYYWHYHQLALIHFFWYEKFRNQSTLRFLLEDPDRITILRLFFFLIALIRAWSLNYFCKKFHPDCLDPF